MRVYRREIIVLTPGTAFVTVGASDVTGARALPTGKELMGAASELSPPVTAPTPGIVPAIFPTLVARFGRLTGATFEPTMGRLAATFVRALAPGTALVRPEIPPPPATFVRLDSPGTELVRPEIPPLPPRTGRLATFVTPDNPPVRALAPGTRAPTLVARLPTLTGALFPPTTGKFPVTELKALEAGRAFVSELRPGNCLLMKRIAGIGKPVFGSAEGGAERLGADSAEMPGTAGTDNPMALESKVINDVITEVVSWSKPAWVSPGTAGRDEGPGNGRAPIVGSGNNPTLGEGKAEIAGCEIAGTAGSTGTAERLPITGIAGGATRGEIGIPGTAGTCGSAPAAGSPGVPGRGKVNPVAPATTADTDFDTLSGSGNGKAPMGDPPPSEVSWPPTEPPRFPELELLLARALPVPMLSWGAIERI